jgi:hypothetical protein
MPAACQAVEPWAELSLLGPGEPVFRLVDQRQIIGNDRVRDATLNNVKTYVNRPRAPTLSGFSTTRVMARLMVTLTTSFPST